MIIIIISLIISICAFFVSVFVTYHNFLKPFKLFVKIGKENFWIYSDGTLRIDLMLTFFNLGIRNGLIDSLILELFGIDNKMETEFIYKFDSNERLIPEDIWHSFLLSGKLGITKNVGFKSNRIAETIEDGFISGKLKIFYIKNFKKEKLHCYEKELTLTYNKNIFKRNIIKQSMSNFVKNVTGPVNDGWVTSSESKNK